MVQITEQLSRQKYSEQCQTFKTQRFEKKKRWNQESGHFDKRFVKNTRKRGLAGKHFGVFSATLKTAFLTHYSPVLLIYTPLKHPKTFRFSDVFKRYR